MYACLGRLGTDVVVKEVGKEEQKFKVSENTIFTSENYKHDDVDWKVKFVGASAKYLEKVNPKKGSTVYVEGYFKTEKWTSTSGEKKAEKVLVVTNKVEVIKQPSTPNRQDDVTSADDLIDDLIDN